jgi:hypothetical protein
MPCRNEKNQCILERGWKFSAEFMAAHTFHSLKSQELPVLKSARSLKLTFLGYSIDTFWLSVKEEYPVISKMAVGVLMPFLTTCLCELGIFSADQNRKFIQGMTKCHG